MSRNTYTEASQEREVNGHPDGWEEYASENAVKLLDERDAKIARQRREIKRLMKSNEALRKANREADVGIRVLTERLRHLQDASDIFERNSAEATEMWECLRALIPMIGAVVEASKANGNVLSNEVFALAVIMHHAKVLVEGGVK